METTTVKTKAKRPSKGVARHNRRIKQEARKNSVPGVEIKKRRPVAQSPKK
jgi:hypothetical protein